FFESLTQKKKLLGASTEHFAANHRTLAKVQTPALSASMNQLSAFAAATKVERLSTLVAPASVTPASLSAASTPRQQRFSADLISRLVPGRMELYNSSE